MTRRQLADAVDNGILPLLSRLKQPAVALIAVAVFLPLVLFALAAWQGRRVALREAQSRAERTTLILEEHALKVFETHRLVIQQVNERLPYIDWSLPEDRAEVQDLLVKLQTELAQIATISVTGPDGLLLASNRTSPDAPKISFADRDWFQALKASDQPLPFVSRAYFGRQSGIAIFNVSARIRSGPGKAFAGVITVSVDRKYFERFYDSIEPTFDHSVLLVRSDGQILAHVPPTTMTALKEDSNLRPRMKNSTDGLYDDVTKMDGVDRILAYRKVGDYPVFVRFGISRSAALAPWWLSLFAYGLVAALASLALTGVSVLALRQTDRERVARQRWEETAAALRTEAAERSRVEDQLRQSQKMEAIGRLTGGVAHDFNNLLTAVIGSLDLARRRKGQLDPQTLGLVDNALEGAHRAAALTSRLLTFSRQQPLTSVSVDANKIIAGMSDLLRRTLGEAITIKITLGEHLWSTASDPNQLENAILNLAVNARDAMPEGGPLVIETKNKSIAAADGRVDVLPGDYVTIGVTDTGSGMAPAVVAKIFEPFFTTKPAGRGTGLGLSQVYGFVKQCGGQVAVQSKEGSGTRFEILLPRLLQPLAAPAPQEPTRGITPAQRGNGETILVVEDQEMVLRLSTCLLEDAGYRVVAATNGRAALDLFRREPDVALLFTDVVLGGAMNGRVLAEAILRERPGLPVLFTSGYTGDAMVEDGAIETGAELLAKPFSSDALVDRIASLIAQSVHGKAPLPAL